MKAFHLSTTLVFVIFLLSGCSTSTHHRYSQSQDGAPKHKIDVSTIPDAVPMVEPLSKHGNPKKYTVLGKTYYVQASNKHFEETGIASWYGTKFDAFKTSSGEAYDLAKMTAAHKTLPIPCYAKVTNLSNGRQVIVKVNDRGPFAANRVMDLSYVAAVKLGIWPKGTGLVKIQTIDPANWQGLEADAGDIHHVPVSANPQIYMQLGAFKSKENADHLVEKIQKVSQNPIAVRSCNVNDETLYKVWIGPLATVDKSDSLQALIEANQLGTPLTVIQ